MLELDTRQVLHCSCICRLWQVVKSHIVVEIEQLRQELSLLRAAQLKSDHQKGHHGQMGRSGSTCTALEYDCKEEVKESLSCESRIVSSTALNQSGESAGTAVTLPESDLPSLMTQPQQNPATVHFGSFCKPAVACATLHVAPTVSTFGASQTSVSGSGLSTQGGSPMEMTCVHRVDPNDSHKHGDTVATSARNPWKGQQVSKVCSESVIASMVIDMWVANTTVGCASRKVLRSRSLGNVVVSCMPACPAYLGSHRYPCTPDASWS